MTRTDVSALLAASALVVVGAFAPADDWIGTGSPCDDEFQAVAGHHECGEDDLVSTDDPVLDLDIPLDLQLRLG